MPSRRNISVLSLLVIVLLAVAIGKTSFASGGSFVGISDVLATPSRLWALIQPDKLTAALANLRNAQEAEQIVQRAWLLAQQAGAYDFYTEIEQTTYHAPALTNVGRPAHVESLYLEGSTDRRAETFELAIWQGSSVLHRDQAYEVRVDGEQSYGRPAGGEWHEIDDMTSLFAPGQDALAYLHGIQRVQEVPVSEDVAANGYRHFRFDVDGPAFAEYMRRQLEDELRNAGKLPAGVNLDTPQLYQGIVGDGEIWLTQDGLPEQLHVQINFPQQTDGSRVRAVIHTDFAGYDREHLAATPILVGDMLAGAPLWFANQAGRLALVDWGEVGAQLGFLALLMVCTIVLVRFRRKPQLYVTLNLAIMAAMVVGPLLQSSQVAAFQDEQAVAQQAYEANQTEQAQKQAALETAWDPTRSPLEVADNAPSARTLAGSSRTVDGSLLPQTDTISTTDSDADGVPDAEEPTECRTQVDCDGDGLTDLQESRLGTQLNDPDSDKDKLRDDLEVKGFDLGGRRWYTDPRNVDTNGDGLPDTLECWHENTTLNLADAPASQPCDRDSDGDGVPDLVAYDNDGDGVDDSVDISPFHRTQTAFSSNTPYILQSNNLTPNEPLFVDFQIVPTSRQQLSYARNVLDWPQNDTKGQVVRTADTTFATDKPVNTYPAGEENGDLRLVPLVEITIPAANAGKILPTTRSLNVTRSGVGRQTLAATQQIWLTATVAFQADNGTTALSFTSLIGVDSAAAPVDRAKIVQSACPADSAAPEVAQTTSVAEGGSWAIDGKSLPDLMDGGHALVLEKGTNSLCIPLGDLPNAGLEAGEMFDSAKLDAYGITLRDAVDNSGKITGVTAYLPANVVTGQTGGEKQAFAVRMAYAPQDGVTSLGTGHEVRLVWMVQLLADDGNTQIVHVYPNETWDIAGLSARQDVEMRSAVVYQDPESPANADADIKAIHGQLWSTITGLDADFATGANNRLKVDENLAVNLESRGFAPTGSLRAAINSYPTQDEFARVPAEVTPNILANFVANGAYKAGYDHALLIFARQEEYKAARWDGGDTLTLPSASSTLASFSWKPFRYTDGQWTSFPAADYLDLLSVRLHDAAAQADFVTQAKTEAERDAVRAGIVLVNQAFAMSMLYGANRMVAVDNSPVPPPDKDNALADELSTINEKVLGATLQIIAAEISEDFADSLMGASATRRIVDNFEFVSDEVLTAVNQRTKLTILGEVAQGRFAKFKAAFGKADLSARVAAAGLAISVVSIGLVVGKLASSDGTVSTAIDVAMPALGVIAGTLTLANEANNVVSAAKGAGGLANAIKTAQPLSRAAKIAVVAGLVLSIGISVGIFVTQWIAGAFGITDLGFSTALSGVIAAIIVAVILLAIAAIPIVGPIIVAVIALIDAVIAAACAITKAAGFDLEAATTLNIPRTGGAKLSLCAGITGLATEAVRFFIFSQTVLVGNMQAQDRLTTSNFALNFQQPEAGFQVGNSLNPTLRVDDKITLPGQPFDWKSLAYFWQFNWDNLDEATHRYDLTTEKTDRDVSTGQMEGDWRELNADGSLTASHRSPGIQYDDPLVMASVTAKLTAEQSGVPLDTAGVNVSVPLYLREAYANPAQECWVIPVIPPLPVLPGIPVCIIRSDKGTNHIDLQLSYDVFPATLDEFYAPATVGDGVSLAWGQDGDLTFPVMRDFDGDGLLSSAVGGNDTDDRFWDSDGDGLSDLFETQKGTRPGAADSDQDGLSDRVELLVGSDPLLSDSDGDGLRDGEEVFHEDADGNWVGGWEFVYDIVGGIPQRTWVTSDPLSWNGDRDTFTDYQESLYGLHPRAVSDPTILKLKSTLAELGAPVTLLRFDERAGATVFADSSGKGNSASCSGNGCPQAGHEGRFTNGLTFDGVDDVIEMAEAVPLGDGSFTVALWARRNEVGRADLVFGSRDTARNEQMWLGFGATNQFACGFTRDSILQGQPLTDTNWRHWACTYDYARPVTVSDTGTITATLYLDGEVVDSRTFPRALGYVGSGPWQIGGTYDFSGNFSGFSGALDELVVAPVALNQRQIRLLMQGQYNAGGDRLLVAPGDGLSYEAELENNLLGRTLTGLLSVDAPTGWQNNDDLTTYQLGPTQKQAQPGVVTVGDNTASGTYSVTVTAGAAASNTDTPQAASEAASDVHFSFDNGQNRLAYGAGRQATAKVGSPATTSGVGVGDALRLDGSTLFEVANDNVFDVSSTDFTYSVWVKPDAGAGSTRAIFGQPPAGREWQYDNAGVFLRVQNDKDLIFGWGDTWNTDPIPNALTPGAWNHVVITFDRSTLNVYVNGVQKDFFTPGSSPGARSILAIGDDNYCGQFELKNVHTKSEGDPGEPSAEYVYRFQDDLGNKDTLVEDTDADSGEWEPGDGPSNNEWFTDKQRTFCFSGARVYVYEDDPTSDDDMSPDVRFDTATAQQVGYNNTNYTSFWSPDIKGDGTVEFYYEIRNPVLPFKGSIDDLRLYRRSLSEEEVQQLHEAASVPYHYTLDDPPGSGLDGVFAPGFNFTNEGTVADTSVQGTCAGSCPTSGLPGRVNRAVSFGDIAGDGMQIAQGIRIQNLSLPQSAPGFSLWVKPQKAGVFFSIYKDQSTLIGSLFYSPENRFCLSDPSTSGAPVCSANTYSVGEWAHSMVNFSGNTMTLHLNNSEQVTYQKNGSAWPGAGTYSVSLAGTSFMGLLDDLRIPYDGGNVAAMMATAPLVSLHLDEENAGVTTWDNDGGVDATCSDNACPDAGRRGKVSLAAGFDGVNDGLLIPGSPSLDLDNFSLAAWISPSSSPTGNIWETIIAKSEGDFRNYALYMNSDRQIVATRNCEGSALIQVASDTRLPRDQFTHVAATYDGQYMALYINGVFEKNVQLASSQACHNDAPLTIGGPATANMAFYQNFNGLLDEVLVYPDALWDYQVADLYKTQANWIEEKNKHAVFVDADAPSSTLAETLPQATNYYANADVQLGVRANDVGSDITLVELGVSFNGGEVTWIAAQPCQDAADNDSPAWCPWFMPSQWGGEGRYTLQTRATDAVGHRENPTAAYTILVDSTGPSVSLNQADGSLQSLFAHPHIETAQILRLDGTANDPAIGADTGSGVRQVWVTLRNEDGDAIGDAPYAATVNGAAWTLAYPFRQAQVAGRYTVDVWGEDAQGNHTDLPRRVLSIDGAAPTMTLDEAASGLPTSQETFRIITETTVFQGWLGDQSLPVGARYAFLFDETPSIAESGRTTFDNLVSTSGSQSAAWCSDNGCPTVSADGRGLSFDGLYDFLSLPADAVAAEDLTFAAWVYLPGPNAGQSGPLLYAGKDGEHYLYFAAAGTFGRPEFFITEDGGQNYQSLRTQTALPTDQWTHLGLTLAGGVARIYVNGVELDGSVWINGVDQGNNRITIDPKSVTGEDNWIGRPKSTRSEGYFDGFNGAADQVVVYHRALNGNEIRLLSTATQAGVASGAVSFTPLWAVEQSGVASPHFSQQLPNQTLYLPLNEVSHPISTTTTIYRNLVEDNDDSATCTGDHCPRPSGSSPVGAAVNFDGQDDFIQLPAAVMQGDNFTFAAWIYWRGGEPFQRIFSFGQDGSNTAELWAAGSELYFSLNTQGNRESLTALTALPTNRWVHVSVTVEGASARLYLDGVEQGAKDDFSGRLSQIVGDKNLLGNTNSGLSYHFNGMMSDVRLFSQALSVWDNKGLRMGNRALLALPLDERLAVDGTQFADNSGWKWPATLHSGAEDTGNKAVPGRHGAGALTFDGVDDYVQMSAEMMNGMTGSNAAFTFASWVYWRGGAVDEYNMVPPQYLFSFGQDPITSADFAVTGTGLSFSVGSGGGDDPFSSRAGMDTNTPLPTDQWVHVAVTVAPEAVDYVPSSIFGVSGRSVGRVYVNGVEQSMASLTYAPASVVAMTNNFLGRSQEEGAQYFNGALDDVRIYPRALNVAEINDLVRAVGHPVSLAANNAWTLNAPTGLEGVYRLDLAATDQGGQFGYNPTQPPLNQTIDTLPPRVTLTSQTIAQGMRTKYVFQASDLFLSDVGIVTPCGTEGQVEKTFRLGSQAQDKKQLTGVTVSCALVETPAIQRASICDAAGNCATAEMTYLPADYAAQGVAPAATEDAASALSSPMSVSSLQLVGYAPAATKNAPATQETPIAQDNDVDLDSGLILHWDFEDGPGNCTVQDRSSSASGGDLSGDLNNMDCTEAWQTDVSAGNGQYSLYFGGVDANAYVTSPTSAALPAGNAPRSLCVWAKSSDGAVTGWAEHMVNYGSAVSGQAFGAMIYTGNTWYAYTHATDINTQIAADSEWRHHCVVYDGATLDYYLDGVPVAAADAVLDTAPNTALVLGARPDLVPNTSFDGWIDEVRLYARALSEAEIQSLYTPNAQTDAQTDTAYPPNTFRFIDLPDVVSNLQTPIAVHFVAAPWNGLTALAVDVNGEALFSETYPGDGIPQQQVRVDWLPPAEGVYHVSATATDALSGTVTISRTVFVDATPPTSVIADDSLTTADYVWGSGVTLRGAFFDVTGVISATAVLDVNGTRTDLALDLSPDTPPLGYLRGDPVYAAALWRAVWHASSADSPTDYTVGKLEVTVYDAAQTPTIIEHPVTFDFQAPRPGEPTILINGEPAIANHIYTTDAVDLSVVISPTVDANGVDLWYGWSTSITTTVDALSLAQAPGDGVQADQRFALAAADGAQTLFFHLVAADGSGNSYRQVFGPYVVDAPGLPDFVHMPQIHGAQFADPNRAWRNNGCTLLGTDSRMDPAQSLYLTRDDSLLHVLWTGADWETDGDLFVYLDTLPGQGSMAAYNPYPSTAQSSVLLLPTGADVDNPAAGSMQADYALWVVDGERAHLLRWDGTGWVDEGLLDELGGVYAFSHEPDAMYTDLVLPFSLIGDPTAALDLVAFAVDAEEGPSLGLRLWSALPYANPVDSARVVSNAPDAAQPHRMMLTDRYTVPLAAGSCLQPEANLAFSLSSQGDGFAYDPTDDATRLLLAEADMHTAQRDLLFAPYDAAYQSWLTDEYCPSNPSFAGCLAPTKRPLSLSALAAFERNGLVDGHHRPLAPGAAVSYTLRFLNPSAEPINLPAYLYSNGDLDNPQAGVTFQEMPWVDGCPGWLDLTLPPGSGTILFTGNVGDDGVTSVTLDIDPSLQRDGCVPSGDATAVPAHRLSVEYTADDGAPGYVAIAPDFSASGPISATVRGVVRDLSAVPAIEIEVNGSSFTCTDDTPLDGQWACDWDVVATNGGEVPAHGAVFSVRARAADIFGQQSDWSTPRQVVIDADAPQISLSDPLADFAAEDGVAPALVADTILELTGTYNDNVPLQRVEVCQTDGDRCERADLRPDALSIPPSVYNYSDQPSTPVTIDAASDAATACPAGAVGLVRTFDVDDSFTVADVEIGLRVGHPFRSDLTAILSSPSGAQVTLFRFDQNMPAQNVNALFGDLGLSSLSVDWTNHSLTGSYARNTYHAQERLSIFAGENANGAWQLTLCDQDPSNDTGEFHAAILRFTAVTPPQTFSGVWSYRADVGETDGEIYSRQIVATDEHGRRSEPPLVIAVQVDNVAPALDVTQSITRMLINTSQMVLTGTTQDGVGVDAIWVAVTDPLGETTTESVAVEGASFTYNLAPSLGGDYRLVVYAADAAGNRTSAGTFTVSVLRPPQISQTVEPQQNVQAGGIVTYTVQVVNVNADAAAENMRLRIFWSEWLTPVETEGADVAGGMLVWPAVDLAPGATLTRTVLARLTDNLMITGTVTGTLPITDWVNLSGAVITSQAVVETDNLAAQESHAASFTIADVQAQVASIKEESEGSLPEPSSETDTDVAAQTAPTPGGVRSLAWTTAGDVLASGSADGSILIWALETGVDEPLLTLTGPGSPAVHSVAWTTGGWGLATGLADGTVQIWDVEAAENNQTTEPLFTLGEPGSAAVNSVAWSVDNSFLAAGTADGVAILWNVEAVVSGQPDVGLRLFGDPGSAAINSMQWASDQAYLFTGTADGQVTIWDVAAGEPLLTLDAPAAVTSLAFSEDIGIAAGVEGVGILVWRNVEEEPQLLQGHTGSISSVVWASGGILVSGADDGSVLAWNGETGEQLLSLREMGPPVNSVAIPSDTSVIAVGLADNSVRFLVEEDFVPVQSESDAAESD